MNHDKFHLLISADKHEHTRIKIENGTIWYTNTAHLLKMIKNSDKKTNRKEKSKLGKELSFLNKNLSVTHSSSCSPLIWVFHGIETNKTIKKVHERFRI